MATENELCVISLNHFDRASLLYRGSFDEIFHDSGQARANAGSYKVLLASFLFNDISNHVLILNQKHNGL